ncbi:MAG: MFS transporter [Alphaproteobacteria bacterium]|nr:MFS transporter [Alphaproteobacteria bacterium]
MSTKSTKSRRVALGRTHPLFPWAVWGLGTLLFFYAFFHRVAPAVMVNELMRDFAVGGAILGTLSALYFYPYAALQIPLGLMLDRWGPRRVLTVAAAFCGLGSLVFATADNLMIAYVGRAMIGAGAAFGWIGTLNLIAIWFPPQRFALLAGVTAMIGMSGAVAGQAPLAQIIHAFGWRETLGVAALYGGVLAIAFWVVVRNPAGSTAGTGRRRAEGSIWSDLAEVLSSA